MDRDGLANFFLGLGIGVGIGMLFAPKSGEETRDLLMSKADEGKEYIKKQTTGLRESAGDLVDKGKDAINRQKDNLNEVIGRQKIKNEYFDRFNFEDYGGTPVLGVNKPVIIGHGISHAKAYLNMLFLAQKMIETNLLGKMAESFKK